MPSAGRPDSWIILSGSTRFRNRAASACTGSDDSLSEFASETPPDKTPVQMIIVPGTSIAERVSTADPRTARHVRTRSHRSQGRALRLVALLAAGVRRLRGRSIKAIRIPLLMGRVRDLRPLGGITTLRSFAGGAGAGVLVMWLFGAQPSLPVVHSTTQVLTTGTTPRPADAPASTPDIQLAAEHVRASSTLQPASIVSIRTRQAGRNGHRTGALQKAVTPTRTRVTSSRSAKPGNPAGAPPGSYRGSLAFLSAPQGARVFVNGAFVGSTPLVLDNLPVGSRAVRMEAEGYQRWSSSTRVVANQRMRVSATLGRDGP